jgi:response regulator of citrate/malate metabolism
VATRPATPAKVAIPNRPTVARRPRPKRPAAADTEAAVLAALANDPGITNAELARAVGVSTRTARRYRTRLASGQPDPSLTKQET